MHLFGKIGEIFHLQTSTKFLALSDILNILLSLYYLTVGYNPTLQVNLTLIEGDIEVLFLVLSEFILILDDIDDCFVLCLPGMLLISVKAP